MQILIDGYNLLFGTNLSANILKDDREDLIQSLTKMLQLAKMEATIIFDAHIQDTPGSKGHLGPLEMIFTEKGELADDLILKKIRTSTKPHHVLVVTSDKRLGERAKRLLAKVISVKEWLRQLSKLAAKGAKEKKNVLPLKKEKAPIIPQENAPARSKEPESDYGYYLYAFEKRYDAIKEDIPAPKVSKEKRKKPKSPKKENLEPTVSEFERWLRLFEKGRNGA